MLFSFYQDAVNPVSGKAKGQVLKKESQRKYRGWLGCILLWSYLWFIRCTVHDSFGFFKFVYTRVFTRMFLFLAQVIWREILSPRTDRLWHQFVFPTASWLVPSVLQILQCRRVVLLISVILWEILWDFLALYIIVSTRQYFVVTAELFREYGVRY